jgi:hypothetical protein
VFNHRLDRHGVYRFFLPTARNDRDDETSSHRSVTDPDAAGAPQGRRQENSGEDRGLN